MKPLREKERPKFGLYARGHNEVSGCTYYRIDVPTRTLVNLGLAEGYIDYGKRPMDDSIQAMFSSDVILDYAVAGGMIDSILNSLQTLRPGKTDDGKEDLYPPSFVFDIDDRIDCTHPFNPAFVRLGVRNYDGQELQDGDRLVTTFPDGTEVVLWEDAVTIYDNIPFDIARNKRSVAAVHKVARQADGMTVPSEALAKFYREEQKCRNVYVFPNSVLPDDYPKVRLAPRDDPSEVRILWQGGASHMIDWFPLRDAIRSVAQKYPQAKFVIWGTKFAWVHDNIPENQLELIDWVPYEAYRPRRVIVDADINLCPLANNIFNEGKSGIKWYESTMPHVPEATLAARVAPYSLEIEDGTTGLLYDSPEDFAEKLGILIEQRSLRLTLGQNARAWVLANRHAEKTVPGLFDFYKMLRAEKQMVMTA